MHLAGCLPYHYFPPSYAHTTWHRLAPFFRLPGRVVRGPETVRVALRPFNDRQLNRDLIALCVRVNEASPRLPDGRRLVLSVERMCNTRKGHDLSREPDVLTWVPLGLEESPRPDT